MQRELGLSLQTLDKAKKRARQSREAASNLKRDLRSATARAKELTAEADARDGLIETFTQILLRKAGADEGGADGSGEEDRERDAAMMDELQKSMVALKKLG